MSSFLTKETLEHSIRRVEGDNGLTIKEIKFSKPDLAGAHFATGVETAKVTVESKEKGDRIVHIFIKRPAQAEAYKLNDFIGKIFQREAEVYNKLLPDMINLSKSKLVDLESCIPKCYAAFGSGEKESIILEDLSVDGYKMVPFNALVLQNIDHVTLVMKAIAKIHATSHVMKKSANLPEKYSCLEEFFYHEDPNSFLNTLIKPMFKSALAVFDDEYSKIRKNLQKFYDFDFEQVLKVVVPKNEKFVVVNHGDFWSNNMMFKYGANGKPVSVKLVDWQATRYNSFAMDLCTYMYASTTTEFRKNHLQDMLKIYYEEFIETVRKLGNEIPFSYGEMYEEFMSKRLIGFIFMPGLLTVGLQSKGEHLDPDDFESDNMMEELAAATRKQMLNPERQENMKKIAIGIHDEVEDLLNEL